MLALKSLIAVGAFALLIPAAMAANDSASPQGIQDAPPGVTAPSNAVPPSGIGGGSNPSSCTKTKTPEQRAAKKAQKAQHVAEGQQPKTGEKNGAAGGRNASRCKTSQPT